MLAAVPSATAPEGLSSNAGAVASTWGRTGIGGASGRPPCVWPRRSSARTALAPSLYGLFAETMYSKSSFFDDLFLIASIETLANPAASKSAPKILSTGNSTS